MEPIIGNKISEDLNVDTSRLKVYSVGVSGIVLAGVFGYLLNGAILNLQDGLLAFAYAAVAAAVFLAVFILQTFFIKSQKIVGSLVLLECLAIAAPFYQAFSSWLIFAWILTVFLFWTATNRGRRELDNHLQISFFQVERLITPMALTGISVFIGLVYVGQLSFDDALISKENFLSLARPSEAIFRSYVKDFSFDMTMSQLAASVAEAQLGPQWAALSQSQKNFAANEALSQLREQISGYGIPSFRNSDTVGDVFYAYLNLQLKKIPETLRNLIPFAFILAVVLAVRGMAIFLRWFAAIPAYFLYQLALFTGFASLGLESRSREIIVLK